MEGRKSIDKMSIQAAVEILEASKNGNNIFVQTCAKRIQRALYSIKLIETKEMEELSQKFKLEEFNNMIIYGNRENIDRFNKCSTVFADGTFKVCPVNWQQLYTLNGLVDGRRVTFFYCLLPGKSKQIMKDMFDRIDILTNGGIYEREFTLMGDFEILNFDFLKENVR